MRYFVARKNRPKFSVARPNFTMGIPIVSCRGLPGSGSRFGDFPWFYMSFRWQKCFLDLSRPISMRNFMGNPFLMVLERYGNAKLVKSWKIQKKSRQTRFSGHPSLSIYPASDCSRRIVYSRVCGRARCALIYSFIVSGSDDPMWILHGTELF